jgi:urate oxidase
MARLGSNRWGKSEVRLSKVHRGSVRDDFSDVTVQILLEGDVEAAHVEGDNSSVLPTDTMRNTIYGVAQDALTRDLEGFAALLCDHFVQRADIHSATATISERLWSRQTDTGFIGGGSERRTARVTRGSRSGDSAGVEGLVVLKTRGSAFAGFPKDEFTILPEKDDRLLATSVTAEWDYETMPADTTSAWNAARETIVDRFFGDWSASVQHQGYLMAEAVLDTVPEISQISFRLPNQHHLSFDLTRFGMPDRNTVFHPVSEPYGDISFTVHRD